MKPILTKKADQYSDTYDPPGTYESYGHDKIDLGDPKNMARILWIWDDGLQDKEGNPLPPALRTMPIVADPEHPEADINHTIFYHITRKEEAEGKRLAPLNIFDAWRGRFIFEQGLITVDIASLGVKKNMKPQYPPLELKQQLIQEYVEQSGGDKPLKIITDVGGIHEDRLKEEDFEQDVLRDAVPIHQMDLIENRRVAHKQAGFNFPLGHELKVRAKGIMRQIIKDPDMPRDRRGFPIWGQVAIRVKEKLRQEGLSNAQVQQLISYLNSQFIQREGSRQYTWNHKF